MHAASHLLLSSMKLWHVLGAWSTYSSTTKLPIDVSSRTRGAGAIAAGAPPSPSPSPACVAQTPAARARGVYGVLAGRDGIVTVFKGTAAAP